MFRSNFAIVKIVFIIFRINQNDAFVQIIQNQVDDTKYKCKIKY